jgi:hypothetical protein
MNVILDVMSCILVNRYKSFGSSPALPAGLWQKIDAMYFSEDSTVYLHSVGRV